MVQNSNESVHSSVEQEFANGNALDTSIENLKENIVPKELFPGSSSKKNKGMFDQLAKTEDQQMI